MLVSGLAGTLFFVNDLFETGGSGEMEFVCPRYRFVCSGQTVLLAVDLFKYPLKTDSTLARGL